MISRCTSPRNTDGLARFCTSMVFMTHMQKLYHDIYIYIIFDIFNSLCVFDFQLRKYVCIGQIWINMDYDLEILYLA